MMKVEAVDGGPGLQAGDSEATFDGTLLPTLQLAIQKRFQGLRQAEILAGCLSQHRIQMLAHRGQIQMLQFLLEWGHRSPFWMEE